jgi:cell division protease FtsH
MQEPRRPEPLRPMAADTQPGGESPPPTPDGTGQPARGPHGPEQDASGRQRGPRRAGGGRRSPRRMMRPSGPSGPPIRPGGRSFRTLSIWLLVAMALFVLAQQVFNAQSTGREISYTEFWDAAKGGHVEEVTIINRSVTGRLRDTSEGPGRRFHTYLPTSDDAELMKLLRGEPFDPTTGAPARPPATIRSKSDPTPWFGYVFTWLPFLLLIGLWFLLIRQMQGGGSAALKFGKSKAKLMHEKSVHVTFADVAGVDEAKQELEEVIEFLREPRKFRRLGGRIPKGVLLVGPPGTGKTLLARAVAGEAAVPFFSISGSDFVEMFVGVGAARVRDLFEQGKQNAPCIIFVDELDAVGRHRGAGLGGGHDEREQTLNQLLVEMDGFDSNEGVIMLAATNRPDVLDPALLRAGRFDRQVVVDRPDKRGREGILKVHTRNKPLGQDVDLQVLARGTPGLAGADLENLVNEAALLAARRDQDSISMQEFDEAKDKVMMGTARRSLIIPEKEKRVTAFHEAGHVLVAWFLPDADPIYKVTVIPRGRALGLTHWLPEDDRYNSSKEYLEQTMAALMGGRAAEEIKFGRFTTGAANDIQRATELARKMVCEWGMSESLGPVQFGKNDELIFLGKEIAQHKDYSEKTAQSIDAEIRGFVTRAYDKALEILRPKIDKLDLLATKLLECEILDREEISTVLGDDAQERFKNSGRGKPAEPAGEKTPATGGEPKQEFPS